MVLHLPELLYAYFDPPYMQKYLHQFSAYIDSET